MSNNYKVGYGKPPEQHRFRKGQSGNPKGRRQKPPKKTDAAHLMKEIGAETITINGREYMKDEALLQVLCAKALKGDMSAMRLYFSTKEKLGLLRSIESLQQRGGVLVVPGILDARTWEERASRNQAQYRELNPDDRLLLDLMKKTEPTEDK